MVSGRDDPRPDDEPAATAAEALAWLRAIRAELRNASVEPPSGRRHPSPPTTRRARRARLARFAGEPDPQPDPGPQPDTGL